MSGADPETPLYPMTRSPRCPFDPPPALARLRERPEIGRVRIWDGSTPWLITRFDEQRAVMSDPRFSADSTLAGYPHSTAGLTDRREESRTFIDMDDPEHARQRRMLTADFTVKRVEAMRPRVQAAADRLVDEMLAAGPTADLLTGFALPLPSLVICDLLGVPYADHEFFERQSRLLVAHDAGVEETTRAADRLGGYLTGLLEAKDRAPGDDLLSRLVVRHGRTGDLNPRELTTMAMIMLIAGHETTAGMIALGVLALLCHPDQLALLREDDDPALAAGATDELLRYLTVVHHGRRRVALEDAEIGGRLIRAGEGVILSNDAGNRDAAVFPDPDRLDIRRDARRHLAFGFGVHQCLGQPLARVELQVAYATIARRIPGLRLAVPLEDVPFKRDGIIHGLHALPVTW